MSTTNTTMSTPSHSHAHAHAHAHAHTLTHVHLPHLLLIDTLRDLQVFCCLLLVFTTLYLAVHRRVLSRMKHMVPDLVVE